MRRGLKGDGCKGCKGVRGDGLQGGKRGWIDGAFHPTATITCLRYWVQPVMGATSTGRFLPTKSEWKVEHLPPYLALRQVRFISGPSVVHIDSHLCCQLQCAWQWHPIYNATTAIMMGKYESSCHKGPIDLSQKAAITQSCT